MDVQTAGNGVSRRLTGVFPRLIMSDESSPSLHTTPNTVHIACTYVESHSWCGFVHFRGTAIYSDRGPERVQTCIIED